jgi:hypothetical protein
MYIAQHALGLAEKIGQDLTNLSQHSFYYSTATPFLCNSVNFRPESKCSVVGAKYSSVME